MCMVRDAVHMHYRQNISINLRLHVGCVVAATRTITAKGLAHTIAELHAPAEGTRALDIHIYGINGIRALGIYMERARSDRIYPYDG